MSMKSMLEDVYCFVVQLDDFTEGPCPSVKSSNCATKQYTSSIIDIIDTTEHVLQ
jgi:hypothetical protein